MRNLTALVHIVDVATKRKEPIQVQYVVDVSAEGNVAESWRIFILGQNVIINSDDSADDLVRRLQQVFPTMPENTHFSHDRQ